MSSFNKIMFPIKKNDNLGFKKKMKKKRESAENERTSVSVFVLDQIFFIFLFV